MLQSDSRGRQTARPSKLRVHYDGSGNINPTGDEQSNFEDVQLISEKTLPVIKVLAQHGDTLAQYLIGEACARGWGTKAVQRSLVKVIENIDLRPPKAAARRSCGIVSV
jgi:hypothetical protein